jgi:hypothetical protein
MGDASLNQVDKPAMLYTIATFKQHIRETLKDAWDRIKEIHNEDLLPCREVNMHLYFYYGLEPW